MNPSAPSEPPALVIAPPPFVLAAPVSAVLEALPEARVVGGAVRDALLGRPVADVDLATPRRPDEVIRALTDAGIRALPTGLAHGTVTAVYNGGGFERRDVYFEVTTLRRDVYTDGRHAVVAYTDQWREDAARRDFTINALSMSRAGEVFDYFNGIADLRAGRVRFVGEPARRIAEDYLRILRFFRFFARYARGEPDAAALAAIKNGIPGLARLSAERVWSELKRILAAPDPRQTIALMDALGVLTAVLPEGAEPARLARLIEAGAPMDPILRLAALFVGDANMLAERLKLSGAERARIAEVTSGPVPRPGDDDATLRRLLADDDADALIGRAWLAGGDEDGWPELRARLAGTPRPVFPLAGRDVVALGIPPGPRVGRLLDAVRAWWMEDGCRAGAAACRAVLAERVRQDA